MTEHTDRRDAVAARLAEAIHKEMGVAVRVVGNHIAVMVDGLQFNCVVSQKKNT